MTRLTVSTAFLLLVGVASAAPPPPELRAGIEAQQMGKHEDAVVKLTAAIKANPAIAESHYRRAVSRVKLSETTGAAASKVASLDSAESDLTQAVTLDSMHANAFALRGTVRFRLGRTEEAVGDFSRALVINPRFADAARGRATAYAKAGKNSDALVDLTLVITITPQNLDALRERAALHMKLGSYDKAAADLSAVLTVVGGPFSRDAEKVRAEALKLRADCLLRTGEYNKALSDYRSALGGLGPDGSTQITHAWNDRAKELARNKEWEHATRLYTNAIEFNPSNTLAYAGRARAYYELGRFQQALSDCDTVLAHNPESYLDYIQRGETLRKLGQADRAAADFRTALRSARAAGEVSDSLVRALKALSGER